MIQGNETLFECLVIQIKNMKPSWERVEQIDYLIHILDTRNFLGRAMQAWPWLGFKDPFSGSLCYSEASEEYIKYNYWTYWNGHGWEHIWKRFLIEVAIHYESMTPEAQKKVGILDTKEKYGMLRVDLAGFDEKLFELESMLEQLSSVTCIHCGKQPRDSKGQSLIWLTKGYILPYCKECLRADYFSIGHIYGVGVSKEQFKKAKKGFNSYAAKCRTVVPYFESVSMRNNCKTYIFRQPAYNWLETYKKEKEWSDE